MRDGVQGVDGEVAVQVRRVVCNCTICTLFEAVERGKFVKCLERAQVYAVDWKL